MCGLRDIWGSAVRLAQTFAVAFVGGWGFDAVSLPLPWVLGPMAAILIWKEALRRPTAEMPPPLKHGALVALGIAFGLQFTRATLEQVAPYVFPYLAVTVVTIAFCIGLGALFAAWTNTDKTSSVFGFIPGGLTEMVVTGEAVGAKPGTVVFLQTVRLLSVLSIVPFFVTLLFAPAEGSPALQAAPSGGSAGQAAVASAAPAAPAAWLWYAIPIAGAYLLRKAVPASYVLVPMLGAAALHIAGVPLHAVPPIGLVAAQIVVGVGLGRSVKWNDLRAMGGQWWRVFALVAAMLALSAALGAALAVFTDMDLPTALLSAAPGGLIEMALTAASVGADAAVVTSLQMVRLYTIIGAVPFLLKWWFARSQAGG